MAGLVCPFIHFGHEISGKIGDKEASRTNGGDMMIRKLLSLFFLFVIPAAVLMLPLEAQSDTADPEEVAHMKAGHKKVVTLAPF